MSQLPSLDKACCLYKVFQATMNQKHTCQSCYEHRNCTSKGAFARAPILLCAKVHPGKATDADLHKEEARLKKDEETDKENRSQRATVKTQQNRFVAGPANGVKMGFHRRNRVEKTPLEQVRGQDLTFINTNDYTDAAFVAAIARQLKDKDRQCVLQVLNSNGSPTEIVTHTVSLRSFQTLKNEAWLNDEVIHSFTCVALAKRDEEMCHLDPIRKRTHFYSPHFLAKLLNHQDNSKDGKKKGTYAYGNVKSWSNKVPGE